MTDMTAEQALEGKKIVVWFSCGAASAVAAKIALEKYGKGNQVSVVYNYVSDEDSDNLRFLKDCEKWLGVNIEIATNPKYPDCSAVSVWESRKFMSGPKGAPCTYELKKKARQIWQNANKPDWHVFGFTLEEMKRHNDFISRELPNVIPVLIDAGMSKQDCIQACLAAGISPPRMYFLGYPNANCPGCVKATSPSYWNHVRIVHPDVFASRAEQSRRLGARLVRYKGRRIFLDQLPPDAEGRPLKSMKMPECGIFCEETHND